MEGGIKFLHFLSVFFFWKVNLKQIEEQKYGSRGVRGYASRKVFKNLDTVMAILELFEQFLWQILFAFNLKSFTKYDTFCSFPLTLSYILLHFPLTLSPLPNMIHFVRTFLIYACLRRKDDCYQIGLKLWKNCIHQKQR